MENIRSSLKDPQLSLERIIFEEKVLTYRECKSKWKEFEKFLSQEERATWDSLHYRIIEDSEGDKAFTPPLSVKEKVSATDLIWKLLLWEFCREASQTDNFYLI